MTRQIIPHRDIADVMRVIDWIGQGHVPTMACDDMGVSYSTFTTLTATYSQLRTLRQEAEDRCYDILADKLLTIHEDVTDPKMANVASGNVKWLLERRRARQYGTKSTLEVNITADREVLDALQAAKARAQGQISAPAADSPDVLDLTIVNGVARAVSDVLPAAQPEFDEDEYRRQFAAIS